MNRLAPLIVRYPPLWAASASAARPLPDADLAVSQWLDSAPGWAANLRLFATAWLAGLVFFGTLLA
jgi:hypothetical protein